MALGHDLAAALPELQAHAESRMGASNGGSTGVVRRKTGDTTEDADGYEVDEWADVHLDLPSRISTSTGAGQSRTISTPGGDITVSLRVASFPVATEDLRDGDLYEVTAGRLTGSVWQIVESDPADQQTARRVSVVATERPSEWPT